MMISKEWLVQGMRVGCYTDSEREVVEDKIDEGFDSLLRLAVRNRSLVLGDVGLLWKESGFLCGRDMKPKYVVK